MTTDSDRISRLEGIIEQIAATLTALHQGQEALRTEMREGDAALRAEMREGDAALRVEMQNGDAALRVEMQRGDAELRSITNRILWINYGIWATIIGGIAARRRGFYSASVTAAAPPVFLPAGGIQSPQPPSAQPPSFSPQGESRALVVVRPGMGRRTRPGITPASPRRVSATSTVFTH